MDDHDYALPQLQIAMVRDTENRLYLSLDDLVSWLGSCQVEYQYAPEPARETLRCIRDVFVLGYRFAREMDNDDDDDEGETAA